MEFGARLRRMRIDAGLTQKELADPAYTAAYISTIEAGKRQPSSRALEHLAAKLSVDPDELLTGRRPDLALRLEDRYVEARRLLATGNTDKASAGFGQLRREAKRYDLPLLEAKGAYGQGLCAEADRNLEQAIAHFDEVASLVRNESPLAGIDALAAKARCLQMTGEVRYSIHLLEQALAVLRWQKLEDPDALLRLHSSLVAAYFHVGLHREASAAAEQAIALSPKASDPERLANMHINVARVCLDQHHLEEAERHYVQAEDLFNALGYQLDVGRVHLARGFGLREEDNLEDARTHLSIAVDAFRATGSVLNEARATNELARVERLLGRTGEARMLLRRSLTLADKGEVDVIAIAHREIALCEAATDAAAAEAGLRKALELFDKSGNSKELAATYRELGDLLSKRDDFRDACVAYRAAALALAAA